MFGVSHAVGMKNVNLQSRWINSAQIVQDPVDDRLQRRFSSPCLFDHVQGTAVRDIEHGLNGQQGAHQRGGIGNPAAGRPGDRESVLLIRGSGCP